jgi:endonuclease/exonuclease/phosphatase family metal-dependent hydrolase
MIVKLINTHKPDVIATQEALYHQIEYLGQNLPKYKWVGIGRDDGHRKGEFTAIFYNKDRLKILTDSSFWLSPTPAQPGIGWDAALNRTVTWAKFRDNFNGRQFFIFNTHFDHLGETARTESAKLLHRKIKEIDGDSPIIVIGDFNSIPKSETYRILTSPGKGTSSRKLFDSRKISQNTPSGPKGTFTGFDMTAIPEQPIDYVFVSEKITVFNYAVLADKFEEKYPSDHFPVLIEISIE